jgi:hypothetical protein
VTYSVAQSPWSNADQTGTGIGSLAAGAKTTTAGNLIHVVVQYYYDLTTDTGTFGVTDGTANVYHECVEAHAQNSTDQSAMRVFRAENIAGGSANPQINFPNSNFRFVNIVSVELSGLATSGPYLNGSGNYQTASAGTAADAVTSGSFSVGAEPAALIGVIYLDTADDGPPLLGTGFTEDGTTFWANGGGPAGLMEDRRLTSTGSGAATFTKTASTGFTLAAAVAYAEAGAVAGGAALAGNAAAAASASGTLKTGAGLAGAATAAATASANLRTGSALTGGAIGSSAVTAALTNFVQVLLTLPLYSGVGSILDPNANWSAGAPGAGSTIYYDGTNIAIQPDGEIIARTNSCTALAQFYNGTTWSQLVIVVTPGLVGYATVASAASGAFSTAAALIGAASALLSVTGTLSTAVKLSGAGVSVTSAAAALTTAIRMAGTAITVASASGSFTAGAAILAGAAVSTLSASAALTTSIQLASASVAVLSAAGALAAQIAIAGSALATSSASGALSTAVTFQGAAIDSTAATASILTQTRISSAASDLTQAAASLTTLLALVGAAVDTTSGSADLTVKNPLAGAPEAVAAATANLSTVINMSGLAWATAAAQGALVTNVVLAPAAIVATLATGKLFTVPTITPPAALADIRIVYAPSQGDPDYAQIGDQPYGEFYQAAGEKLWYAINWNEWLANRWQPNAQVTIGQSIRSYPGNGYQQTCTIQGRTASTPPAFEPSSGAFLMDGSVEWVTTGVDDTSLGATVVTSYWNSSDQLALSSGGVRDECSLVLIDTTGAIKGVDYDVQCTATMSDGQVNIGKLRIKVR